MSERVLVKTFQLTSAFSMSACRVSIQKSYFSLW